MENIYNGIPAHSYLELLPDEKKTRLRYLFSDHFSDPLQDIAKAVSRAYDVTPDEAIEELRRFLAIKVHTGDGCDADQRALLTPTHLIDELWQAAIRNFRFYSQMTRILQTFVKYVPSLPQDQEADSPFREVYEAYFFCQPLGPPPLPLPVYKPIFTLPATPPASQLSPMVVNSTPQPILMTIDLRDANDQTLTTNTYDRVTIGDIKTWYGQSTDHPTARFVLYHGRTHLLDEGATLGEYEVKEGDVLDVVFVKRTRRSRG